LLAGKSPIICQLHFYIFKVHFHAIMDDLPPSSMENRLAWEPHAIVREQKTDVVKVHFQEFVVDIGVVIFRK